MLTLRENSQDLMNTVNFVNDRLYYFASKYRIPYELLTLGTRARVTVVILCVCMCLCLLPH